MSSASAVHIAKFKLLRVVCVLRRMSHAQLTTLFLQTGFIAAQCAFLLIVTDWVVASLVHLPMLTTIIALLAFTLPVFYLSWVIIRWLSNR